MGWIFKYKLHHVLFWLIYLIFWTYFSVHNYRTHLGQAILGSSIYFFGQGGIGYLSIYLLVPRYFFTKRYAEFAGWVLAAILLGSLFITVGMTALFRSMVIDSANRIGFGAYFFYSLLSVFFSTLLFISVRVMKERVQVQKINSILEKEKIENELKFLKSQINPHFLFNAINSIYVLIKKDPDLAAAALARFSDMLRYQLYECNFAVVPIGKEVEYLDNYIEMEKLRKGTALSINYEINLNNQNFLISPLLLIPFVENAIKHVSNFTEKVNVVDIRLNYQEGTFKLMVRNSIDHSGIRQTGNPASGIGQDNTKRRLNLIYPDSHQLVIEQHAESYFVSLTIQIA